MDIHPGNLITSAAGYAADRLGVYAADGDVALDIAALFCSNDWARV